MTCASGGTRSLRGGCNTGVAGKRGGAGVLTVAKWWVSSPQPGSLPSLTLTSLEPREFGSKKLQKEKSEIRSQRELSSRATHGTWPTGSRRPGCPVRWL